jgi:NADPH2:quinone reductase
VVEALGKGVKGLKPGARVYLDGSLTGTYASHALCSAAQVHPLPKDISLDQGAALGVPSLTAARALFQKALVKKGEKVLVHGGSGGVGLAAIQMARSAGVTVFATAGTAEGLDLCRREGAHHALDHKNPRYQSELMELTKAAGWW